MPSRFASHSSRTLCLSVAAFIFLSALTTAAEAGVTAAYVFTLSDFTGAVPYNWVRLSPDPGNHEIYVYNTGDSSIRVFNEMGMQIFSFNEGGELGPVRDVTTAAGGDLLVLVSAPGGYGVKVCNYRGEYAGPLQVSGIPPEISAGFSPEVILSRNGTIYLLDRSSLRIVTLDGSGRFRNVYDIGSLLKIDAKRRRDSTIIGFSVDRSGNMLFTIPVLFSAYIVTPEGKLTVFGSRGSSPGKFNVIGGITADDRGTIYIVDTLRCVVMIFDRKLTFIREFGYRGDDPGNLVAPMDLAVQDDLLFVTQSRSRGVSVFRIQDDGRVISKGGDAPDIKG